MTETAPRFRTAFPVAEAKLRPPAARPGTIARPRLLRLLAAEPGPRVVSVIAPAGYGKTTLLAQWAARERRPVAWLTLGDLDNDPAVMLTYLAVALDRIAPVDSSIRTATAAPRERVLATAVPRLASELARHAPVVLVLDDVHRIVDRTALDALAALIDHLPDGVRVVIAGRTEPDLPIARLRAQRDLLEIDQGQLALDEPETTALAAAAGDAMSPAEVHTLVARAEGWAAGIYLAILARGQGPGEPGSGSTVSGRDRYIAAYLRAEIERDLADDDVAFLTRTAVLEVITPAVADVVGGQAGSEERIRALARGNLLIQEIDGPEPSFRYHNLLREFLLGELERREPGAAPDLHRRASAWYLAAGDADLAVEHALASGDADAAAQLVTALALPTFYGGRPATLDRWLRLLDVRVLERHPPLAVIAGWIHLLSGRPEDADRMADLADWSTFGATPGDGSASFESSRAMLRAVMARHGPHDVLVNAELAVARERPDSPWRANALWLLGSAHLLHGDLAAADARFAEAVAAGQSSGGTAMASLAGRASIAMARGDWAAAEELTRRSHEVLVAAHFDELVASLLVHAVGARVALRRGNVAAAREALVSAQIVRPLASHAAPWFSVQALLELARAYLAASDPAGAQVALRQAEQIVRHRPALGVLTDQLLDMRARLGEAAATLAGSSTLTNAELRLLPLLPTYLSFQEIADRLQISRNTVKTHAMSIYGKLQASSRGEAVERAVEIGLLEPYPGLELPARPPA
jgi:LuxR family maltose regulon positive regulatory protein